ncbi:hypothetical protein EAI30_15580 [Romboutsia ilealis]|uniref:Type I restriction enzyme HsdR N-terminal domain-containing protein n=1 Tax=Romboutsia faecis TaxID=2764597 RepID=A0ABR7JJP4_9FIRM|nr:type I restriction enzyme HsdR N-terminal domain-containing protein [Romboutsia faecis]MBC5995156.1 type I restriction enzyme HsdR N-terminal domain-containing protein [Romboutsia faecis]MRN26039.1 hypothetical protein [Romboutsia ilealis]
MSQQLVKERVIKYLMEDLLVPHDMIDTDVPLSEFEEGAEGVLDIIVNVKDSEDYYAPVLIVKCLDEDVEMEGETVQKQVDFLEDVDNITMAGRMILTNGNEMMYADWTGEEYDTEAELPTYDQMVKEFFEMEEKIKELEAEHHHGDGCGCGHDHGHHHEEGHECGCGGHDSEGGCCGGHNHDEHHECGCGHHHE